MYSFAVYTYMCVCVHKCAHMDNGRTGLRQCLHATHGPYSHVMLCARHLHRELVVLLELSANSSGVDFNKVNSQPARFVTINPIHPIGNSLKK